MKNPLLLKIAPLLLLFNNYVTGQDFSNKGKDFWVVYTGHVDGTASRMALYITSDQNAKGTVEINGSSIPFTVTANNVTTVQLTSSSNPSNLLAYNSQVEGIGTKKGIHITADKPVIVYSHILNSARSGSTMVLPTLVLGKEYYASSYRPISASSTDRSQFAFVATIDNTVVEITPTAADANSVHLANTPFRVTLNKGDVYQYQSNGDLTGTHIKSVGTATATCQPIAVFSGSTRTSLGCTNPNSGDNLYQQLFPFASWGRLYYTAPFANRAYDLFRIIVQDATTVVTVNGVQLNQSSLINGRFYELNTKGDNTGKIITSDKPVCVFQYLISQGCDEVASDPEMIVLNAADQTLNSITVMSARNDLTPPNTNIVSHFLNIIFKTSTFGSLMIDGSKPIATPVAIPGTNYSYIQENVTGSTNNNPAHRITSDSGFNCIAYGYGNIESYGYNAGTNVINRYQYINMHSPGSSINLPATCTSTPFSFSITLPYKPTSLQWDFNNNPNLHPNAAVTTIAPAADSTFIKDGKTLYVYKLKSGLMSSSAGTFPMKVIAQSPTAEGCSGAQEINYEIVVYERPKANFSIIGKGCLQEAMQFNDTSTSSVRPLISYHWNFGDNTNAIIKSASKKYNSVGTYPVKLTIFNDIGCVHDTTKPVTITGVPKPGFYFPPQACASSTINFYDSSKLVAGTISKWTWNFGDQSKLVNKTNNDVVPHNYTTPGIYSVTLLVESTGGCKDSLSKTITINATPVANFITPAVCLNDAFAQFTDSSLISDGTQNSLFYRWNFGDAQANSSNPDTSSVSGPRHKFSSTGNFSTTLSVTSKGGCTSTISKSFTVNGSFPAAAFIVQDSNSLCSNTTVNITNKSTVAPGAITKLEIIWDAGSALAKVYADEAPFFGKEYSHHYPYSTVTKKYEVKLRAYSGQSCVNETKQSITINGTPDVSFLPIADACFAGPARQITEVKEMSGLPGTGSFSGTAVSALGIFTPTATALSSNSGTFPLLYSYTTDKGCTDTATSSIKVWKVTVNAGPEIVLLEGKSATLNPVAAGDNLSYQWLPVSYLNTSKNKNPVSTPPNDISYTVTVTGNAGCTASDNIMVKILKSPEVPNAFSPNNDGINDVWNIRHLGASAESIIEVYNRYGILVYRTIGYNKPWNGTSNGKELPTGVYYYVIDPRYGRPKVTGSLTIVK